MRLRNTVIAFVVLLVIGGYAFVNYYFAKPVPKQTLLNIKSADIGRIDLKYANRELVIERGKAGAPWRITRPIKARADRLAANSLATAIADCKTTEIVAKHPTNLAQFGLAKPKVTVVVTTVKGKTLPGIEVGKLTPVGFKAYIKLADKPAVMLTSSSFPPGMEKTVDELRDRRLMNFKLADVKKFTLRRQGKEVVEVDREKGDKWEIVAPRRYAADQTEVRDVLAALSGARIASFVNDSPINFSQYGLAEPQFAVTVYTGKKGENIESLLFGHREPGKGRTKIYVRRGDRTAVYAVQPFLLTQVDKTLLDLRDKTVLAFDKAKVESVKIDSNGKSFTLDRAPHGKWNLVRGGKTSTADAKAVSRFLDRLRRFKGDTIVMASMVHPEMFGMVKPAYEVTLVGKDGKPLGTVKLAKVSLKVIHGKASSPTVRNMYYATSSAGRTLYRTDRFKFGQLDQTAANFLPAAKGKASTSRPAAVKHPA